MSDDYRDVAEAFERIAPDGPRPDGWATTARRRSRGRRAAVGVAAVAAIALLADPIAASLAELTSPTVTANPADPTAEDVWVPPVECMTTALAPDESSSALPEEIVTGSYCWGEGVGTMQTARWLMSEELDVVVAMLGIHESLGFGPLVHFGGAESGQWVGQLWLESADGGGILVLEGTDGSLLWRTADGELLLYPSSSSLPDEDPMVRAALDGILAFSRALEIPDRTACWVEHETSEQGLSGAVAGYLCDPTGKSVAEVERPVPADVVRLVKVAADVERERVGELALPTGWSLVLEDNQGAALWLNQLADGKFAYQDQAGGEWAWTPQGEALEALKDLGMAHLR